MTLWQKIPFAGIKNKIDNKFGKDFSEKIFLYSLSGMIIIYAIMCASFKSAQSIISSIDNFRYILAFLVLIKIYFLSDYTFKELLLLSLLYCYMFLNSIKAYDSTLFFTAIMIFGAKDISYNKICKYVFFTTFISALAIFMLYFAGITNDVLVPRGEEFRHSLGFAHPNTTGLWVLCCAVSFQQFYNDKIKLWHYGIFIVSGLLMYATANSRASFIALILICIIMPIVNKIKWPNNKKLLASLAISAVIFVYIFIMIMVMIYDETSTLQNMLDKILSYRLSLSNAAFKHYGLTLFANSLPLAEGLFILDCMQIRIAFSYGTVTLLLSCAMLCFVQKRTIQHKQYFIATMGLILLMYGLMETFPYNFAFNVTLFAVSARLE